MKYEKMNKLWIFLVVMGFFLAGQKGLFAETTELSLLSQKEDGLIKVIAEAFELKTGIKVKVTSFESAGLGVDDLLKTAELSQDILIANDILTLEKLKENEKFIQIEGLDKNSVPEEFMEEDRYWVGFSYKVNALVYNKNLLLKDDIDTILEIGDLGWKGKLGMMAGTDESFITTMASMIFVFGFEETRDLLSGMKQNSGENVFSEKQTLVTAVADQKVSLGLLSHDVFYQYLSRNPDAPIGFSFPDQFGHGVTWDLSGVGIVKTSKNQKEANQFVQFLISKDGQTFISESSFEYPVNASVEPSSFIPRRDTIVLSKVSIQDITAAKETALELIGNV